MIYLDNSATTEPDQEIVEQFKEIVTQFFANPSSIHQLGGGVEKLQAAARSQVAQLLNIDVDEVVFTSGGTESNNAAIKGTALANQSRGKHIITTAIEHASVYETCKSLEKLGFEVTYLPVNNEGQVSVADLKAALRDDTILVSVMHVNNEIGSIQPIEAIGEILQNYPKIYFHVDAVQSLGKLPMDLKGSKIDLCSFSGHKIHGLNGTGMLYLKSGTQLFPLLHGGGQEASHRSGTENVAGNVAFAKALRKAVTGQKMNAEKMTKVKNLLLSDLKKIDSVTINTPEHSAPHIIHFSVAGIKPEVMIHDLYEKGFVVSTQSACSSKVSDKSRVLEACGKSEAETISGIRVSLNETITVDEIKEFTKVLRETIDNLKMVLG